LPEASLNADSFLSDKTFRNSIFFHNTMQDSVLHSFMRRRTPFE